MTDPSSAESTAALQVGFRLTGWTLRELWMAAAGIGGALRRRDIQDITDGARPATRTEHDVLASALNDFFVARGDDHPVPLWDELTGSR